MPTEQLSPMELVERDDARLRDLIRHQFRTIEPTADGRPRRVPILPIEGPDATFVLRLALDGIRARRMDASRAETAAATDTAATPC